jgi:uncharacterized protein (DUF4415 family)
MKQTVAEPVRQIDFTYAVRGAPIAIEPGKTKISIRLDNRVLDYFRAEVEKAGAGNYQTLINDALVAVILQRSMLDALRLVVREELAAGKPSTVKKPRKRQATSASERSI